MNDDIREPGTHDLWVVSFKSGIPLEGWDGVKNCTGYFTHPESDDSIGYRKFWVERPDGSRKGYSDDCVFVERDDAVSYYRAQADWRVRDLQARINQITAHLE